MESLFKSGVRSFLESSYIDFIEYGNTFIFPDYDFQLELIPAGSLLSAMPGGITGSNFESDSPVPEYRES